MQTQSQTSISQDLIQSTENANALDATQEQQPASMTQRYDYECKLGKGSQGQVWLAKRKSDGEKVAIKQFNIHSVTTWKQYELFKREADILESLHIDGVVPFYEYIEDLESKPAFVCIVQKFIEGRTLAEMIRSKHRFETEAIYDIVAQTLRILKKLHEHQPPVVHRDIKPSNLMLTPTDDGRFKVTLLDFGAVANPQVQNGGSTVAGTFGYMPPEQLMGQAQPASDIYALAAVAVELLSGTSPADIPVCDFKLVIEPYLTHVPANVIKTLNLMLEPAIINRIYDHTTLIAQFDALANKIQPSMFDFLRRTVTPKLQNVESICQPGNYELWQEFDPEAKLHLDLCPCHLDIPKKNKFQLPRMTQITLAATIVLFLLTFGFLALALTIWIFWPLCITFPLLMGSLFVWQKQIDHIKKFQVLRYSETLPVSKVTNATLINLSSHLKQGKKLVGTIAAIIYKETDTNYVKSQETSVLPHMISYDIPKFWVIYRFRYPTREKTYDFYAKLTTHVAPENRYKVGDPMTLVANLISSNDKLELSVLPYPYPFGDILTENEILYSCLIKELHTENDITLISDDQSGLQCLVNYTETGNIQAGLRAADIYHNKFREYQFANNIYQQIAQQCYHQLIQGDTDAGSICSQIYRDKLNKIYEANQIEKLTSMNQKFNAGQTDIGLQMIEIYRDLKAFDAINRTYDRMKTQYLEDFHAGDPEAGFHAAEIYIKTQNPKFAQNLYAQVASRYIEMFNDGFVDAIIKAVDIYRKKLHDDSMITNIIQQLIQEYNNGKIDAGIKAAEIYKDYLYNSGTAIKLYQDIAMRYCTEHIDGKTTNEIKIADDLMKIKDIQSENHIYQFVAEQCFEELQNGNYQAGFQAAEIYRQKLNTLSYAYQLEDLSSSLKRFYEGFPEFGIEAAKAFKNKFGKPHIALKLYHQAAEQYIKKYHEGDTDAILKAADIYKNNINDKEAINRLLDLLIKQCNSGNIQAGLKAADIYKNHLNNNYLANQIYQKVAKQYEEKFQKGNIEAGFQAIDIYESKLNDLPRSLQLYQTLSQIYCEKFTNNAVAARIKSDKIDQITPQNSHLHQFIAEQCVKLLKNGNADAGYIAAKIYRQKLQNTPQANQIEELASHTQKFNTGNIEAAVKAARIYQITLKDVATARLLYQQAAERYLQKFQHHDIDAGIKAAEIYQLNLQDFQLAKGLYQQVAQLCIQNFHNGDSDAICKAADIYRNKLYDDTALNNLIDELTKLYQAGNILAGEKAADIYRIYLKDHKIANQRYQQVAQEYDKQYEQGNIEAGIKAADIYYQHLKDNIQAKKIYLKLDAYYTQKAQQGDTEAQKLATSFYTRAQTL